MDMACSWRCGHLLTHSMNVTYLLFETNRLKSFIWHEPSNLA